MNINDAFIELIEYNKIEESEYITTVKGIVKKLNDVYYSINSDNENFYLAGSINRKTAIKQSDIDLCFVLPDEIYTKYSNRKGNEQSALLQEVKNHLKIKYPNTEIKADGQVVDANFKSRLIELIPCFEFADKTLKYPDTNNGGSWLTTSPYKIKLIVDQFCKFHPLYRELCQLIRTWKEELSVNIKGIEIDMLLMEFLEINFNYNCSNLKKIIFIDFLIDFFNFLLSYSKTFLTIRGDNEQIKFDKNKIKSKVKDSIEKLNEVDSYNLWENCKSMFGKGFPNIQKSVGLSEQFIQDKFNVKITKSLKIDCKICRNGFIDRKLLEVLQSKKTTDKFVIETASRLEFYIDNTDVIKPFDIYWKVRNVGEIAEKRNAIRGEIIKGKEKHFESSDFHGPHYVECFIVKDDVCVARDRIDVYIK